MCITQNYAEILCAILDYILSFWKAPQLIRLPNTIRREFVLTFATIKVTCITTQQFQMSLSGIDMMDMGKSYIVFWMDIMDIVGIIIKHP
jgi:hypothetical protein